MIHNTIPCRRIKICEIPHSYCYMAASIGTFSNLFSWSKSASHYIDVLMTTMASHITSFTVVYSTVYSDANQRKHQSSASLAFVWGIHRDRWISRTKGQLRGKCFPLMTSSWFWYKFHGLLFNRQIHKMSAFVHMMIWWPPTNVYYLDHWSAISQYTYAVVDILLLASEAISVKCPKIYRHTLRHFSWWKVHFDT